MIKLKEVNTKKILEKYDRANYETFFEELYIKLVKYFDNNYPVQDPSIWKEFFRPVLPEDIKRDYAISPDEFSRKKKEFTNIMRPVLAMLDKSNLKGALREILTQCITLYTQKQNLIQKYESEITRDFDKIYWGVFLPTVQF